MSPRQVRLKDDRGGVLPDAAALAAGAYRLHRAGSTGRGVRVGLSDSGVGAARYFAARSYRLEGLRSAGAGHGTGMAAVLLAIAPDATVVSAGPAAAGLVELLGSARVDVILCAWGVGRPDLGLDLEAGPPVIAADVGVPGVWPAAAAGVTAVGAQADRPLGPFSLPGDPGRWSGPSVVAAVCVGLAALAIGAGTDPRRATRLAASLDLAPTG